MRHLAWIVAVVVLANAAALASVVRNRQGAPEAALRLTERELSVTATGSDTTGMTLLLRWNDFWGTPWLDRAKLTSLGFDCSMPPDAPGAKEYYSGPRRPRSTYLVLEYDESGQRRATDEPLAPWNEDEERPEARARQSRLRAVDAGNDPLALRQRYADRHRYLITAATVSQHFVAATAKQPARLAGGVGPEPRWIYVPPQMQQTVTSSGRHYYVTLEYGSRLIPRIVAVSRRSP